MEALKFRQQWWVLLFALFLDVSLAQASAASTRADAPADGQPVTRAEAQIDFRIVIPERLNMPSPDAPPVRTRRSISRTVEQRQDRTVITVSMP